MIRVRRPRKSSNSIDGFGCPPFLAPSPPPPSRPQGVRQDGPQEETVPEALQEPLVRPSEGALPVKRREHLRRQRRPWVPRPKYH